MHRFSLLNTVMVIYSNHSIIITCNIFRMNRVIIHKMLLPMNTIDYYYSISLN